MAQEAKPTNEHIVVLLERVLEELDALAQRQGQIEAELNRLADAAGN